MSASILEKITIEKNLIYVLVVAVLITFGFIFYLFFGQFTKSIQLLTPMGSEELEIGKTYQISWRAKGIDRVGIVLFKGEEPKLIEKNIPADVGTYDWKIYPGQSYGDDYWAAVFEYPWQKGNKIAYSKGAFAIIYPELASCDDSSIQNEWPYIPSDFPNLRRVFITETTYYGNLGALDGANIKCQNEAQSQGFAGKWLAFLGGDSDQEMAVERIKRTPRKTDGVFIQAQPAATLIRGVTCHRLLGKNFDEFLAKFSELAILNEKKLEKGFFEKLGNIWIGRLDNKSKKNCIPITSTLGDSYESLASKYSFTATCQNWTKQDKFVEGYPVPLGQPKPSFPTCYTPEGKFTDACALGGLSTGLLGTGNTKAFTPYQGKTCDTRQNLLCIEE